MDFSEESGDQRRRHRRSRVQLPARIKFERNEVAAVAENISPGGAFLRIEEPVEADDLFATIQLPHGRGVHVHAKVRWRRADPPGIGVEFADFLEGPWEELSRSA